MRVRLHRSNRDLGDIAVAVGFALDLSGFAEANLLTATESPDSRLTT